MTSQDFTTVLGARIALGLFLVGLLILSYRVLQPFIAPVAWAIILAYASWPAYCRLQRLLGRHTTIGALLMTLLLTGAFVVPLMWVIAMLRTEIPAAYLAVIGFVERGPEALPPYLGRVPWLGDEIERLMKLATHDPGTLRTQAVQWFKPWVDEAVSVLGDIGRTAFKFGFALLTVFFLYRDGESLLRQAGRLLRGLLGARAGGYLQAIGNTTWAVMFGLVLTALAQGVLAGLGYWVAGIPAPVLLGMVTAVLALVPFGAPLMWGSVSVWLLATGEILTAIGLTLWGGLVVSQIDNLLRPYVISTTTRIPFLFILFGVLGGISAFGLIGLFLGPIIIAVLLAVWREWIEEQASHVADP
jgi:predicted PurR-regulated permease PerM